MAKRERIPELHETKPNREQRRHPGKVEGDAADEPVTRDTTQEPDVPSVRAKSSGHRKKAADKWNQ